MTDLPSRLNAALEGRYSVDREIGAGGMATVYLAHDVRHERAVALKVLKPELSAVMGGERFLSEIRTTANLQHPHILPLYDSGDADGFLYYVMPYVEGETLRERLAREKQLSVSETLRIAKAVGNALDFAHRKGVVHRDIKPANILLQDGQPLVADFGIALAVAQAGGGRLTETGLSLGTPHYMSPEQATADRDPDARSDIYSLACVVYEMLTGEPPHLGGNAQAVLARILTETARPVRNFRSTVPTHVDAALSKALQKLPADRFDTAADFLAALEGRIVVDTGPTAAVSAASGPGSSGNRRPWLWPALAAAALLVGGTVGWVARRPAPTPPPPLVRMYVEGDSTYQVTNACCGPSVAVSRDGQRIAFMAKTAKGSQFFVRGLDDVEAHPVEGTESGFTPFFDPTGRWLGFVKDERLMRSDLTGGTPLTVATVGTSRIWGAAWSEDGFIYYTPQRDSTAGIFRVDAQGGTEELFSPPDTSVEVNRASPSALPGGRGLLYVSWPREGRDAAAWVGVIDLKDGSSRRLTPGIQPYYADGYLVYALADGSVMARPFDLGSLEVTGEAYRLGDDVITHNASDTEYAVSLTGTLVTRRTGGGLGGSGNMPVLRVRCGGPPPSRRTAGVSPSHRSGRAVPSATSGSWTWTRTFRPASPPGMSLPTLPSGAPTAASCAGSNTRALGGTSPAS
jgi:serine/threonine-protein kinase